MLNRDMVVGVALMSLSVVFFAVTWTFPVQEGEYVSPRVFPRFVSGCLFVLALVLVSKNLMGRRQPKPVPSLSYKDKATAFWRENAPLIAFAVVAFAYTRVIDTFGFIASTLVLLACVVLMFKERRWYVVVAVSVIGTSVYYCLFRIFFKVPLPRFDLF